MSELRAGDIVRHRPTGEEWIVAAVEGADLAWCGWPDGLARVADVALVTAASDEEHVRTQRQVLASRGDHGSAGDRLRLARRHNCDACRAEGLAEEVNRG